MHDTHNSHTVMCVPSATHRSTTQRDGEEAKHRDGEEAKHRDGEEAKHRDGEEAKHRDGVEAKHRDGEEAKHRDGEEAKHRGGVEAKHRDGEEAKHEAPTVHTMVLKKEGTWYMYVLSKAPRAHMRMRAHYIPLSSHAYEGTLHTAELTRV